MVPDYSINDAHHDGFECGILYALRYAKEVGGRDIVEADLSTLAIHLESKKCWKTYDEWLTLLKTIISR